MASNVEVLMAKSPSIFMCWRLGGMKVSVFSGVMLSSLLFIPRASLKEAICSMVKVLGSDCIQRFKSKMVTIGVMKSECRHFRPLQWPNTLSMFGDLRTPRINVGYMMLNDSISLNMDDGASCLKYTESIFAVMCFADLISIVSSMAE